MSLGLIGRKVGMTRIFTDEGNSIPVTVIDLSHNNITQIKTTANDGYDALQIGFGKQKPSRLSKSQTGHFAKAGVEAAYGLTEFRVDAETVSQYQAGAAINVDLFKIGDEVDVCGTTIGKGFSGSIKRHHFSSNRASHGNSLSHNKPGSIGQNQDPGRVFPGKRMAGHLGNVKRTIQNLKVIKTDEARHLLYVKGGIPGAEGQIVTVCPAIKSRGAN